MYEELNVCFRLRVKLSTRTTLVVTAWDDNVRMGSCHHQQIDVEAALLWYDGVHKRKRRTVIFPKGSTWCGLPVGKCTDSDDAKELVLSLLAMRPGDTDSDYFASYTPEQLEFATSYGEELSLVALDRYGER